VLRLQTFEALGRSKKMLGTHLDSMMSKLTESERGSAANILRYLVTPAGQRSHRRLVRSRPGSDLPEVEVQSTLDRFERARHANPANGASTARPAQYEIFHDVLADGILDWRAHYLQEQKRLEAEAQVARQRAKAKRLRLIAAGLSVMLVIMIVLAVIALRAKSQRVW